jgi:hypothetical protein
LSGVVLAQWRPRSVAGGPVWSVGGGRVAEALSVSSGGQWWARRCGRCCHTRHPEWPQRSVADFASYRAQRAEWHQAVIVHVGSAHFVHLLDRAVEGPELAGGVVTERWRVRSWPRRLPVAVLERRRSRSMLAALIPSAGGHRSMPAALSWSGGGPGLAARRLVAAERPGLAGGVVSERGRLGVAGGVDSERGTSSEPVDGVASERWRARSLPAAFVRSAGKPGPCRRRSLWAREWEGAWVGWAGWSRTLTDKAQRRPSAVRICCSRPAGIGSVRSLERAAWASAAASC